MVKETKDKKIVCKNVEFKVREAVTQEEGWISMEEILDKTIEVIKENK